MITTGSFSNTGAFSAPSVGQMSSMGTTAPSGGGGGAGFGVAMGISQAIIGVTQSIMQGKVAKAQANYNATLYEGKARLIDYQKQIEAGQYDRYRSKFMSKLMVAMAGMGLMPSGSPMAVMIDSLTQINIDKAIGQFNLEQQKQMATSQAEAYRVEGRNAKSQATTNAFSSVLKGSYTAGMYKYGTGK